MGLGRLPRKLNFLESNGGGEHEPTQSHLGIRAECGGGQMFPAGDVCKIIRRRIPVPLAINAPDNMLLGRVRRQVPLMVLG